VQEDKKTSKGGGSPSFDIIFYFGGAYIVLTFFLQWANQIGLLQKNKVELVRHPQLINMKQNKYPQFIMEVDCSLQAVLARAKNGDKLFLKEKFHVANGKAQACTQGALLFLIGWWEDSFSFSPGSQMCSHTKFRSSS
jgi:hypothetical protein